MKTYRIGILGAGQTASGNDLADGFDVLNEMMGSWSIQSLTVPYVERFATALNLEESGGQLELALVDARHLAQLLARAKPLAR